MIRMNLQAAPTGIDVAPASGDAALPNVALRIARLQARGLYVFPYAPHRWRVMLLVNDTPRIVGCGCTLAEALNEADEIVRHYG